MRKGSNKAALTAALLIMMGNIPSTVMAAEVDSELTRVININLPAGNLADAITELSIQTDVQILVPGDLIKGKQSNAINGQYSVEQALEKLVKDSGLVIQQTGSRALSLVAESSSNSTSSFSSLDAMQVTGSYILNDKIDTATGLGLSIYETPQSITVMTKQRILDQDLHTITDVVANTVGITTRTFDNVRNEFISRGFGVENYQIDGVPISWSLAGDSGETISDMALYERVEFVRGATGLLTGAGDPSASINLVRKHADSKEFEGYVDVSLGSWSNRSFTTDLAAPLNSEGTIRGRFVAKYEEGDSFIDRYEDEIQVFYGVVEADITPDTLVRAGISHQENTPTSPSWGALPTWYDDGSRTDWDVSKSTSADWTIWDTKNQNYYLNLEHFFDNGWQLAANYNHTRNTQETRILYLWGTSNRDTGLGMNYSPYRSDGDTRQNSFDIRLTGDFTLFDRAHEFVVGALHSKQQADTVSFNAILPNPVVGNFNTWDGSSPEPNWSTVPIVQVDLETKQKGFYGATRLGITDQLKVILGGRIASWDRKGIQYGSDLDFGDHGVFIPYVGALYDVNDQHRLYMSYTEIFQPQNQQDFNGSALDPEEGKSHEIGLKSSFFNDALHTTFSLFLIKQDNVAQLAGQRLVAGNMLNYYRAADGVESKGFEFEVAGELREGWNLSFGYSQFKADDETGAAVNTDHPRKQLKLFTTYEFVNRMPGLVLGGGINWEGESYNNAAINPVTLLKEDLVQESFSLVNLMAKYKFNEQLSLQANVENLFDKKYYAQIGFYQQYKYGVPRSFSVGLKYQF